MSKNTIELNDISGFPKKDDDFETNESDKLISPQKRKNGEFVDEDAKLISP
jgi:hypothetical protein